MQCVLIVWYGHTLSPQFLKLEHFIKCAGDSRAVLCRAGQAIPLTDDHKAAREDETVCPLAEKDLFMGYSWLASSISLTDYTCSLLTAKKSQGWGRKDCMEFSDRVQISFTWITWPVCMQARVEAAGGHILYWNGVRVMGVLAVSRAIGDHCLRPFVISEPEVFTLLPCTEASLPGAFYSLNRYMQLPKMNFGSIGLPQLWNALCLFIADCSIQAVSNDLCWLRQLYWVLSSSLILLALSAAFLLPLTFFWAWAKDIMTASDHLA